MIFTQRFVFLGLALGITFGILFLYFENIYGLIAVAGLLLLSYLVTARAEDGSELGKAFRYFVLLIVLAAAFTVTLLSPFFADFRYYLLGLLVAGNLVLLVVYVIAAGSGDVHSTGGKEK
jgi:hypothetical protein